MNNLGGAFGPESGNDRGKKTTDFWQFYAIGPRFSSLRNPAYPFNPAVGNSSFSVDFIISSQVTSAFL
jgi:hypothetical protein